MSSYTVFKQKNTHCILTNPKWTKMKFGKTFNYSAIFKLVKILSEFVCFRRYKKYSWVFFL